MTKTRPSRVKSVKLLSCTYSGRVEKRKRKSVKGKNQLLSTVDTLGPQDVIVERPGQKVTTQSPLPKRITRRSKKSCDKGSALDILTFEKIEKVDDELSLPESLQKCETTKLEDLTGNVESTALIHPHHHHAGEITLDVLVCHVEKRLLPEIQTSVSSVDQSLMCTVSGLDTTSQCRSSHSKSRKAVTKKEGSKPPKFSPPLSENLITAKEGTLSNNNNKIMPPVLLDEKVSSVSAENEDEISVDAEEYPQPSTYSQKMQRELARQKQLQDMRTREEALARKERFLRRQGLLKVEKDRKEKKSIRWKETDLVEVYLYSPCSSSGSTLDPEDIPDVSTLS